MSDSLCAEESTDSLSTEVADGARLTDRPQGTGRPFGLRTPPRQRTSTQPIPKAGQKKSADIEQWALVRLVVSGCQSWLRNVPQRFNHATGY
jgi:hypothetical protein